MPRSFSRTLMLSGLLTLCILSGKAEGAPSTDLKSVPDGHYELDASHTSVLARVSHLGLSHFTMRFMEVSGSLDLDSKAGGIETAPASIDVRTDSVATGSKTLDSILKGDFWFASKTSPDMIFVARHLTLGEGNHGVLEGDLTLHEHTHAVELNVTFNGYDRFLLIEQRLGFSATGLIKRSDFGMTAFVGPVGDEIELIIESEFVRKGPVHGTAETP
jgi:polyisoprenoid-binding protein YceI